ncbi:MAG: flippase-like domain-containing protein, partial [Chloroflexi bacterium]|nr:flippase-like domain-containing protein [Chloroflexota bacterium]
MEPTDRKKRRQFWLGMGISAACLAAIFLFIEPVAILEALKTARYGYLALSGASLVAFMIVRATRWRFMLNNDIPWEQVFHIQNIGYMLTMLLPFRLGDVARAVLIGNVPPVTLAQGVSTMVVERILDMMFIIALLPFTLAEVETLPVWMQSGARGFGIVALAAIVVLIAAANQRPLAQRLSIFIFDRIPFLNTETWVRRINELLAGLNSLTRLQDGLILIILSILVWLPILIAYRSALTAVHIQPTWAMTGFTVCAAAFSVALPSS